MQGKWRCLGDIKNPRMNMKMLINVAVVVLFVLGAFFLARAYGEEEPFQLPVFELPMNSKEHFQNLADFHEKEARRCFKGAQNSCYFLPELRDSEKARYCFTSGMSLLSPGTPMSKVIGAILTLLTQYGLDCFDEYNKIDLWLKQAMYHYEMNEFYLAVLERG